MASAEIHGGTLSLDDLRALNCGHIGETDAPCPVCGPGCRTPSNRNRKVLRIWDDGEFITYKCARCEISGWALERSSGGRRVERPAPAAKVDAADKSDLARFLWGKAEPAGGTLVARYLNSRRCWIESESLRFLPGRGDHPPAMIARFDSPGITGVHLTKLKPDGSGKAGTDKDKIMIGPSAGQPIIVHDNPDRGEIIIAEGIEDAASLAIATGWTAWAAGSAGRISAVLPLARRFEKVFVPMDRDRAGRMAVNRCREIRPDIIPLRLWRVLPSDKAADANKAMIAFGADILRAAVDWCDALAGFSRGMIGEGDLAHATAHATEVFGAIAEGAMQ